MNRNDDMKVPFYKPPISIYDYVEVFKTLRTGWLTTGKRNKEFVNLLSKFLGVHEDKLKLVSSCTAGLHLLYDAFNLKDREVIIPSITFISAVEMAIHTGARPVIVDVEDEYITISLEDTLKKINKNTKAMVPVHYAGNTYDVEGIKQVSRDYDLVVIEDSAHAFGTEYNGVKVGDTERLGVDASIFSFYATKTLQTGEGGLISTHNRQVMDRISKTYLHGMDRDAWKRYQENVPLYDITEVGFKYNFPDILASIGIAQLKNFEKAQRERERVWNFYQSSLKGMEAIRLPKVRPNSKHSYHLFVVRLNLEMLRIDRNNFVSLLSEKGIGTSIHFTPIYRFSKYRGILNLSPSDFPVSERVFSEIVSFPIYPSLSNREIEYVVSVIEDLCLKYRR